jgi:hypothetical protein
VTLPVLLLLTGSDDPFLTVTLPVLLLLTGSDDPFLTVTLPVLLLLTGSDDPFGMLQMFECAMFLLDVLHD